MERVCKAEQAVGFIQKVSVLACRGHVHRSAESRLPIRLQLRRRMIRYITTAMETNYRYLGLIAGWIRRKSDNNADGDGQHAAKIIPWESQDYMVQQAARMS